MGTPKPNDQSCIRMWMKPWRSGWRRTRLISTSAGRWFARRLPNSWRGYILTRQNSSSRVDGWPNSSNDIRYGRTVDLARVVLQTQRSSKSPCHTSAQSWTSMHLLTYTTWTKLGFSTVCKPTTRLPPDSSKAASRTRSASPSLYAQRWWVWQTATLDHQQVVSPPLLQEHQHRQPRLQVQHQQKCLDDIERLQTVANGFWSAHGWMEGDTAPRQLQCAHQRRRYGEVQHSAEEHNIALPTVKHHLENSAVRCWNHLHIQGLLPPSIQQPTVVKDWK